MQGKKLTFMQPITLNTNQTCGVVPVSPALLGGRAYYVCLAFGTFRLHWARLHYLPIVGTDTGGMVAMTALGECRPVDMSAPFNYICNTEATLGPVWSQITHEVRGSTKIYPIVPKDPQDIPFVMFACANSGYIDAKGLLFLEMCVTFGETQFNADMSGVHSTSTSLTSSINGWQSSALTTGPVIGVCVMSTTANFDLGELVIAPKFVAATTDYAFDVQHNEIISDPVRDTEDRGVIYVMGIVTQ